MQLVWTLIEKKQEPLASSLLPLHPLCCVIYKWVQRVVKQTKPHCKGKYQHFSSEIITSVDRNIQRWVLVHGYLKWQRFILKRKTFMKSMSQLKVPKSKSSTCRPLLKWGFVFHTCRQACFGVTFMTGRPARWLWARITFQKCPWLHLVLQMQTVRQAPLRLPSPGVKGQGMCVGGGDGGRRYRNCSSRVTPKNNETTTKLPS